VTPEEDIKRPRLVPVRSTPLYSIFDDVLPAEDFARLWEYIQLDEFTPAHLVRWEKAWRLTDGQPLVGTMVRHLLDGPAGDAGKSNDGRVMRCYPTRGGIDSVIALLLDRHDELAPWIGARGRDWKAMTARPYLYPAGTALAWHTDAYSYSGAFVFYAHPQWSASWGGELMISDASTADADLGDKHVVSAVVRDGKVAGLRRIPVPPALDQTRENEVLVGAGLGEFVIAKPNRLVIMRAGTPHRIARVDAAAGDNVRCSVGGCFLREATP
jgi:hypothetical protein